MVDVLRLRPRWCSNGVSHERGPPCRPSPPQASPGLSRRVRRRPLVAASLALGLPWRRCRGSCDVLATSRPPRRGTAATSSLSLLSGQRGHPRRWRCVAAEEELHAHLAGLLASLPRRASRSPHRFVCVCGVPSPEFVAILAYVSVLRFSLPSPTLDLSTALAPLLRDATDCAGGAALRKCRAHFNDTSAIATTLSDMSNVLSHERHAGRTRRPDHSCVERL